MEQLIWLGKCNGKHFSGFCDWHDATGKTYVRLSVSSACAKKIIWGQYLNEYSNKSQTWQRKSDFVIVMLSYGCTVGERERKWSKRDQEREDDSDEKRQRRMMMIHLSLMK